MTDHTLPSLLAFMKKREAVRRAKDLGKPWPWTDDPILKEYRFCNIRRNDDKQTRLIHYHWLHPYTLDPDVWFAMAVARLVNWWPTLEAIGYPVPWRPRHFVAELDSLKAAGAKVFTGAYMVRADPHATGSKAAYLAESVLTPMWKAAYEIRPRHGDLLDDFHKRLMKYRDMGSFMAAQIVADVKYAEGSPLSEASDWKTWAASGPGSRRGLSRLTGRPLNYPWKEDEWRKVFAKLHTTMVPLADAARLPYLTGQDLQNCLCELDKYERVRLGEGRPRARYNAPTTQENLL